MSSIKRDVKKKVPPRPEDEKISVLEIQPTELSVLGDCVRFGSGLFHSRGFIWPVVLRQSSLETGKRDLVWCSQPWFYRRLVAYRYFWLSEGA